MPSTIPAELEDTPGLAFEPFLGGRSRLQGSCRARHLPNGVRSLPVIGLGALLFGCSHHLQHTHVPRLAEGRPRTSLGNP